MEEKIYVANIQKFCVHDGPGIRTVVFFMGCPLRCRWCQNPENLHAKPVIMYDRDKCAACGECLEACPQTEDPKEGEIPSLEIPRDQCISCGNCSDTCLTQAKSICGKQMTAEEIYKEVMKDEAFFRSSGGGVTLSGGEPLLYSEFVADLLSRFQKAGICTTVETCGYVPKKSMEIVADTVDLFLYDFKIYTSEIHQKWTGRDNDLIKENLDYLMERNQRLIIRIPLIPGVNDGEEFRAMIQYLRKYKNLHQIHILPFHQIGSNKYALTDRDYEMSEFKECTLENAQLCADVADEYGFEVNIGGWDVEKWQ